MPSPADAHGLCAFLEVAGGWPRYTWKLSCGWSPKRAKIPDFHISGAQSYREYGGARMAALRRARDLRIRILEER